MLSGKMRERRTNISQSPAIAPVETAREIGMELPKVNEFPAWERRVREEQADLEITKLRRERAALIRAEREEREERERAMADRVREAAKREADTRRTIELQAKERVRLEGLRAYGRTLAWVAPTEYQAKVARDLVSSVNAEAYPAEMADHLAKAEVSARVDVVLKPWRDALARERATGEDSSKREYLVMTGHLYACGEVRDWDTSEAARAMREVDRALRQEVRADWEREDAHDLVDEVLDEWEE